MRGLFVAGWLIASLGFEPTPGRIEGRVHYPGCFPPNDLTVCAQPIGRGTERCTRPIVAEDGITFQLVVPPGRWLVYARSDSMLPGRRAYYSRAVECGLSIECHDHAPIPVEVESKRTVTGVHPDDWWG